MSDTPAARVQPQGSGALLSRGAHARLPRDLVARAHKRLATASLLAALAFLLLFPVMNLAPPTSVGSLTVANFVAAACVAFSLGVYALTRLDVDPERLLDYALIFEVMLGLGVAFAETFATYDPNGPVRGISWLCLLIVLFPLVVPSTPGKTLVASVATASTSPVALATIIALGAPAPSLVGFLYMVLPGFFSAGLAMVCSRILNRLTSDVEEARQMGSYQLVHRLGRGGMGEVWRARHRMLARPAAIKLVSAEALAGRSGADIATLRKRFEREARAISTLTSPHTVQLFDFGMTEDGTLYYVMELLDGVDLETLVREHGPLPPERAVHILVQICESLAEAHEAGLVHRDVKPANVYLCRLGTRHDRVKVLDFGLVSHQPGLEDDSDETRLTADGTVTGTPAYMAPEMITGDRDIDNRSDLYSVGCVAYWLLTGKTVFEGTPVQMVYGHVEKEAPPPSTRTTASIPPELEAIVLACLSKEPGARPADARELVRRLLECDLDAWTEEDAASWWEAHPRSRRDDASDDDVDVHGETVLPARSDASPSG